MTIIMTGWEDRQMHHYHDPIATSCYTIHPGRETIAPPSQHGLLLSLCPGPLLALDPERAGISYIKTILCMARVQVLRVFLEATRSDKSGLEESIIKSVPTPARAGVWIRESRDVATAKLV